MRLGMHGPAASKLMLGPRHGPVGLTRWPLELLVPPQLVQGMPLHCGQTAQVTLTAGEDMRSGNMGVLSGEEGGGLGGGSPRP